MQTKKGVKEYGATCATTLRLTEPWKGSGRIVIGDSWFSSVKTASKLFTENGLYSIMLVKTAHKLFPVSHLSQHDITCGELIAESGRVTSKESEEPVLMLAVCFKDLQMK